MPNSNDFRQIYMRKGINDINHDNFNIVFDLESKDAQKIKRIYLKPLYPFPTQYFSSNLLFDNWSSKFGNRNIIKCVFYEEMSKEK